MGDEIIKTVLRIIQDYCFDNSAAVLSDKFSLAIAPIVTSHIKSKSLDLSTLRGIAKKRNDFFIANNIDFSAFCKGLFRRLNYELTFNNNPSFFESMKTFKRKMENGNFRGFPKPTTSEDTLRSTLAIFIQEETFCEPRAAAGNDDISVPSEKVIIETKLWKGVEYYYSGYPELNEYLDKNNYCEGYYIIFDYNQAKNQIIEDKGEIFDVTYDERLIHVIFIKMNAIRPSKKYQHINKSH